MNCSINWMKPFIMHLTDLEWNTFILIFPDAIILCDVTNVKNDHFKYFPILMIIWHCQIDSIVRDQRQIQLFVSRRSLLGSPSILVILIILARTVNYCFESVNIVLTKTFWAFENFSFSKNHEFQKTVTEMRFCPSQEMK